MKPEQLPLHTEPSLDSITIPGRLFKSAQSWIESNNGQILGMKSGKSPALWHVQILWNSGKPQKPFVPT